MSKKIQVVDNTVPVAVLNGAPSARLTVPGSDEAKNGTSLSDMIRAEIAKAMAGVMAGIPVQGNSPIAQTFPAGVRAGKSSPKATPAKVEKTAKVCGAKSPNGLCGRCNGPFDAMKHYSISAVVASTKPDPETGAKAFIGLSSDADFEANPVVIVGVQRQAIVINTDKARTIHALLTAYLKQAN